MPTEPHSKRKAAACSKSWGGQLPWLVSAKTSYGEGIRTATNKERGISRQPTAQVDGQITMENQENKAPKANCAVVTYTAIFGSEKAPEESKAPDGDEQHDSDSGQTEAPDTAKEPVDLSGLKRPVMIGVVVLALGTGGVFAFKKFKERR